MRQKQGFNIFRTTKDLDIIRKRNKLGLSCAKPKLANNRMRAK